MLYFKRTRVCLYSVIVLAAGGLPVTAQDELTAKAKAGEVVDARDVVVPSGDSPFTVRRSEIVRVTGHGIAGSTITPDVKGPATIIRASYIRTVIDGETRSAVWIANLRFCRRAKGKLR